MYMEGGECNEERREKDENQEVKEPEKSEPSAPFVCTNPECTRSRPNMETENMCVHAKMKKEEEERKKQRERTILPSGKFELFFFDIYGIRFAISHAMCKSSFSHKSLTFFTDFSGLIQ